jgi:ribosome-associated toxin RatA of RatAB toxin-antitoxin module
LTNFYFTKQFQAIINLHIFRFTAEQMYDIVYTVGEYPQFVPWCKRADVHKISDRVFEAELYIGFPPLSEHYRSRVTALYPNVIRVSFFTCFQYICSKFAYSALFQAKLITENTSSSPELPSLKVS